MAESSFTADGLGNFLRTGRYAGSGPVTTVDEALYDLITTSMGGDPIGGVDPAFVEAVKRGPWPVTTKRHFEAVMSHPDIVTADREKGAGMVGAAIGVVQEFIKLLYEEWKKGAPAAMEAGVLSFGPILKAVFETSTGLSIGAVNPLQFSPGGGIGGDKVEIGKIIANPIVDIFDFTAVAKGFFDRDTGPAELTNMQRFMGTNLRMQAGSLGLSWLTSILPFNLPRGFHDVADRLDRAMGFEDAQEEIIQVFMEAGIQKGLEQKFNRETLPKDYTYSEAGQLHIMGKLDRATMDKVWDNEGIRKDTRENQLDLMAKNFTDSEVRQMYERGLIDEEGIIAHFRDQVCTEEIAKRRAEIVTKRREWDLEDDLTNAYLSAFASGDATESEVRTWLNSQGYSEREADLAIQVARLKGQSKRTLSNSELKAALKFSLLSPEEVEADLLAKGYNQRDTTVLLLSFMYSNLPKGKRPADCDKLEENAAVAFFAKIATQMGLNPAFTSSAVLKYLKECLLK